MSSSEDDLKEYFGMVEWLQKVNTLHRQVDILYVVDGYEVTITWDDSPISEGFHGETVAKAIGKAMNGFDFEASPKWLDKDIYGHERQMAALSGQRDELLSVLQSFVKTMRSPPTGPNMTHEFDIGKAERAIAKALTGESK